MAWAAFAAAALASIVLVGLAGKGQTLKGDEWVYASRLATLPLFDAVFEPPAGKYLLALPMLLYKAAFSTIGVADYLPYRLAGLTLTVAAAGLFLVLAARRVGYIVALPASVLLLFLGSAGEVTATPLRIPEQIALVAGLGMLLALERRDLTGDVVASALLLISVTSHPMGTAFLAAAAVYVLARPAPERWQRTWVFLVPGIVFAAWYFTLRTPTPLDTPLAEALRSVPRFEVQSVSAMAAAATGIFRSPFGGGIDFLTPLCYALGAATVAAVGLRAITTRPWASFWAILAALLVLFAAPAFAPGGVPRAPYGPLHLPGGPDVAPPALRSRPRRASQGRLRVRRGCGRGDRVCVLDVFEHLRARVPRPALGHRAARPRPSSPSWTSHGAPSSHRSWRRTRGPAADPLAACRWTQETTSESPMPTARRPTAPPSSPAACARSSSRGHSPRPRAGSGPRAAPVAPTRRPACPRRRRDRRHGAEVGAGCVRLMPASGPFLPRLPCLGEVSPWNQPAEADRSALPSPGSGTATHSP